MMESILNTLNKSTIFAQCSCQLPDGLPFSTMKIPPESFPDGFTLSVVCFPPSKGAASMSC